VYVEPGRRQEFIEIMQKHDVVTDFESRIYRKDGSIIWISEKMCGRCVESAREAAYYEGTVGRTSRRRKAGAGKTCGIPRRCIIRWWRRCHRNIFRKNIEDRFTFVNQRFLPGGGAGPAAGKFWARPTWICSRAENGGEIPAG